MKVIITGSSGLIGSEAVSFYAEEGWDVIGIDNNQRESFFGPSASTLWNKDRLLKKYSNFESLNVDIRDEGEISKIIKDCRPNFIIHCAAQPSHDLAAKIPFEDFTINANGTLNILEAMRQYCQESIFVFMSTNKVYGDNPNFIPLKELTYRYDFADDEFSNGIPETFSIDNCKHSLFGVSKAAADLIAQEYGKYYDLKVGVFRGGCLTGQAHSSVELHGFLSYLVKCIVHNKPYIIFGYKGKQVRDQIHSADVIQAFEVFRRNPKKGEVYNMGGGKNNSCSILESINKICKLVDYEFVPHYKEGNRSGDHICYYSDLEKFKIDFPEWDVKIDLDKIIKELVEYEIERK